MDKQPQVVLEYTDTEVQLDNFTNIVLYDILGSCNMESLKSFNNPAALKALRDKYGDKAFLKPDELKYPIINPKTGKIDQALLNAAYIDLKRKAGITGTGDLAQKARDMIDENYFVIEMNSQGETMPLVEFMDSYF